MPQFYINRGPELNARPPFSRPLTIRSCAGVQHDAVPLSHIYVTSRHYAGLLKQILGNTPHELTLLPDQDAQHLRNLPAYPSNFRNLNFDRVSQLHAHVRQHSTNPRRPKFVLINGIGTGLGDNYIGIGVLQRLIKLLTPLQPEFSLMQELEERIEPIYTQEKNVSVRTCYIPLDEFLSFDFLIDFSEITNMPSFNDVPAAHFNSHAFSVNKLIPDTDIQPNISINKAKTEHFTAHIKQFFCNDNSVVLLHPLASSSLRQLPSEKAAKITKELIQQGYNVVSAFAHKNPPAGFLSLADQSNNIDDLIHIIDAVDAVISVGTVVYHLASALGKPTIVLPTVLADVRSAKLLPEVLAWTPKQSQSLYLNLHKSEDEKDLAVARNIWQNVNESDLVNALSKHIDSFTISRTGSIKVAIAPDARPKVALVVPYSGHSSMLANCFDSLQHVEGFDPQYVYPIKSQGLGVQHAEYTNAFNAGIHQALDNGCDYVWLCHENARIPADYLTRLLAHFSHTGKVAIVGNAEKNAGCLYAQQHFDPDHLTLAKNQKTGLQQPWVNFSSVLIRADVMQQLNGLNTDMQRLFCDADFCIRAAEQGWQTWHDPTIEVEFVSEHYFDTNVNQSLTLAELKKSAAAFYTKWASKVGSKQPEQIEQRLLHKLGF